MAVSCDSEDSEMERIINAPGRSFLGHLAPSIIPHYPYRDPEQFLQDFERECNPGELTDHWFMLTGVTQSVFNDHFSEPESGPFSRGCAFDPDLKQLLIAMPESKVHAVAATAFSRMVDRATRTVGMEYGLNNLGAGSFESATMGMKQADTAWQPMRIIPGRDYHWPTMVLEVALSERRSKLQSDIRWWFRAPPQAGAVSIVLTLRINRNKEEIIIDKWERSTAPDRGHLKQRVVVSRSQRAGNITIDGAPLIIGFNNVFLRPPLTPEEVDLQLDDEKLEFIAEMIWSRQYLDTQ
ncbi:uncharacterized protein BJX67DRAFT_220253 [Aspergillus lucknowensis]|uniref:Uncharacterized protein n=1 Tax=Aspergillus lucknowensis TaxID=176173 RepID=A0ABR4LJ94_9EURO